MTDDSQSLNTRDVIYWVLHWAAYLAIFGWTILFCALIGAYFGNMLGMTGRHCGWVIGAVVAIVGVSMGKLRGGWSKEAARHPPWQPRHRPRDPKPRAAAAPSRRLPLSWNNRNAFYVALISFILGGWLGGSMLLVWFSISMSPLAPVSWSQSVRTADPAEEAGSGGLTTKHPVPIILFLGTAAAVSLTGFVLGGLGIVRRAG